MTTLNHAEKDALIKELKEKLKEMKKVEKELTVVAAELSSQSLGIHKDAKGIYHIVRINYDVDKNLAAIDKLESCNSNDYAIALYQAKKALVDIMEKSRGSKYIK